MINEKKKLLIKVNQQINVRKKELLKRLLELNEKNSFSEKTVLNNVI